MTIKTLVGSSLLAFFLCVGNALAIPLHQSGCETPMEAELQICWDATGDRGDVFGPFPEMHLFPIAWEREGNTQVLADYSRTIFRQLLPSDLTENLTQEWEPATNLNDAIVQARRNRWSYALWISPRLLRASSAASPGVLDWDVYVIRAGRLLRTLRIRVESAPKRPNRSIASGTAMATALTAVGALFASPFGSVAAVAGTMATAPAGPPEAGRSLELMTELAVRQITVVMRHSMEGLKSDALGSSSTVQKVGGWLEQVFTPK